MIGTVNTDLEKMVIGEMFSDERILIEALSELTADDFSDTMTKTIFESAAVTLSKGQKVDPVTIQSEWIPEQKSILRNFLYECFQGVISTSAYKNHFKQLQDLAIIRKARAKTADLFDLFESTSDIELLRGKATDILQAFDSKSQEKRVDTVTGFDRFIEEIGQPREYMKTGIKSLDYFLKIEKGDFIIIGGRPSSGKTAITLQMAANMSETYKVVYFSLETSSNKLFDRLIANKSMTDFSKIKRGELNAQNKQYLIEQYRDKFARLNLVTVDAAGMSVSQIQSTAIQEKADAVFIDYIGLINCGNSKLSPYEKMSQISIALHTMAQYQKMCVFALCQLNRSGKDDPDMTSLRDSGQIEQDADAIILLSNVDNSEENKHIKKLFVAKNKEGETGDIRLLFQGNYQRFSSYATDKSEYTDVPFS